MDEKCTSKPPAIKPIREPNITVPREYGLSKWQGVQRYNGGKPITQSSYVFSNKRLNQTVITEYVLADDGKHLERIWEYKTTSDSDEIGNHLRALMGTDI